MLQFNPNDTGDYSGFDITSLPDGTPIMEHQMESNQEDEKTTAITESIMGSIRKIQKPT